MRGKGFDGSATMSGKLSGVYARIMFSTVPKCEIVNTLQKTIWLFQSYHVQMYPKFETSWQVSKN